MGLKSNLTPPPDDHLYEFEHATYEIIKNIEFQSVRNICQSKLNKDLKNVKSSGEIMLFAHKTTNMYKMLKEEYAKLINATKTYTKTTTPTKKKTKKQNTLLKS